MRALPLIALALAASVPGAELVRRDLVTTIGTMAADFDYEVTSTPPSSGSDSFDTAAALRVGGRWSWQSPGAAGAPVLGADLRLGYATYQSYGDYRLIGLAPAAGYGYAFSQRWSATGEAFFEYGVASLDLDDNAGFAAISASGRYFGYGLRLGGLYALSRRWSVGAEVGYEWISAELDAAGGRGIDIDQAGLTAGLTAVYRWSFAPGRLE